VYNNGSHVIMSSRCGSYSYSGTNVVTLHTS